MTTEPAKDIHSQAESKLGDFLLAEYEHMCESFLRNEESGEKRAAFFVTLVGGAGGILGFVFGEKAQMPRDQIFVAAAVVAAVLLCFGFLTVRRLIQRNVETDKIIFALRTLRRLFLKQTEAKEVRNAFYAPYKKPDLREVKWNSFGKGGWLHTVAFVNALLTFIVVFSAIFACSRIVTWPLHKAMPLVLALVHALPGGFIVWVLQLTYAESIIDEKHQKLLKEDRSRLADYEDW